MKKIVLFILLIVNIGLYAQTSHMVTNTNDSGSGSLRSLASIAVAGDTIRFSPSLIALGSDTISLTTGDIDFGNNGIFIKGLYNTNDTLCISGNHNSRIFSFDQAGKVVLDSLFLINGNGTGSGLPNKGGAIYRYSCYDTLFLKNSTLTGNTVSNYGGGIYSYNISGDTSFSSILLINCNILGNTASRGGGVYVSSYINNASTTSSVASASVIIKSSTISGNTAFAGAGGGINCNSKSSYLSNSTITSSSSIVNVINSTLTGNISALKGGGIYSGAVATNFPSGSCFSSVTITNSTLSGNTATTGGGIYSYSCPSSSSSSSSSLITINGSIVADNGSNGSGIYNTSTPTIISNGYNVFSDSPVGSIGADSTNITALQLNLQALAFNGGILKLCYQE